MGGHGWVSRVEMGEGRARRPWGLVVLRECRGARTVHMRDGSVRLLDRREADEAEACHKRWEGGGAARVGAAGEQTRRLCRLCCAAWAAGRLSGRSFGQGLR